MDGALARLYAESGETDALTALVQGSHDIVLAHVEDALSTAGYCKALCALYEQLGEDRKLIEAWSK